MDQSKHNSALAAVDIADELKSFMTIGDRCKTDAASQGRET
jgi:hypothetical protein